MAKERKFRRTAIDLFCGAGGLTLGLKQAGFEVLWAVDNNGLAMETYEKNHPNVTTETEDISLLGAEDVRCTLGLEKSELDLLAGCPPCQGFSTIRTLNGAKDIEDERNELVFEVLDFVQAFQPKALLLENVPGLIGDARLVSFEKDLSGLGYEPEAKKLNAAKYGTAQRRHRMILLAGKHGPVPWPKPDETEHTVAEKIRALPPAGNSGDALHDVPERRTDRIMRLIKKIPEDGGSRTDLPREEWLDCHKKCDGFKDVYGRMAWDEVAPTITTGGVNPSKGRFLHPEENRAITLREAALIQGFPQEYWFSLQRGKHAAARMIGNALPPPLIERLARSIYHYLIGR
jgi:DNA (cytosine-5)-methyltransferase 1